MSSRKPEVKRLVQRFNERRLCLKNVPIYMTKPQIINDLLTDFEDISVYMPPKTYNEQLRSKLVFVDFEKPWHARVARKLINLIDSYHIVADFALDNNDESGNQQVPELIQRTVFTDGTVPEQGMCVARGCERDDATLACKVCFTSYCATFYCSEQHQINDWPRHKHDCKPLPKLVLPLEQAEVLLDEVKPKGKFFVPYIKECLGVGELVNITHVASERVFFVRPVGEEFNQLVEKINNAAEKAIKIINKPEINDTVLAPFNGSYRRAQIVSISEGDDVYDCLAFFIDYGQTMEFVWRSFKRLTYRMRALPRYTFKVILEDVKVKSNPDIEKYLSDIQRGEQSVEIIKEEMRGADRFVVLKRRGQVEAINDVIKRLANEVDSAEEERIMFDESSVVKIATGTNVKIYVTDVAHLSKGMISCMTAKEFPLFWKKDLEINAYGNSRATDDEPYEPILKELCLAKLDGRWERGAVVELNSENIVVMLVDRCAIRLVAKRDVRKLPPKLATGLFAQLCLVDGINEKNLKIAEQKIKSRENCVAQFANFDFEKEMISLHFSFLED